MLLMEVTRIQISSKSGKKSCTTRKWEIYFRIGALGRLRYILFRVLMAHMQDGF